MPSSLAEVLPFAFVFSTRLPVSVCGTDGMLLQDYSFSRPMAHVTSCPSGHGFTGATRLPPQSTQRLTTTTSSLITPPHTGTGILTRCPSPTLPSLGLGPTNPTRTDLPSETLDFRRIRFSLISRYSCQHSHSYALQYTSQYYLLRRRTLPYHNSLKLSLPSVVCLRPVTLSAQLRLTRELLRTL